MSKTGAGDRHDDKGDEARRPNAAGPDDAREFAARRAHK
jgi:hypothetical protein